MGFVTREIFAIPGSLAVAGPAPLTTPAFPSRYASPLQSHPKLQSALDAAITGGPGVDWRTPVCVVSLSRINGKYPVATFRGDENHYSASLVKVAALYCLFEMRKTLRAVAVELGPSATTASVLNDAAAYLNPRILAKTALITPLHGVARGHALPKYAAAFDVIAGGAGKTVEFSSALRGHATKMITVSDNHSAGVCVHGAGYGYLNGALAEAGFFDTGSGRGMWLAGDYSHEYPRFTIDSVNDHHVAQVATVLQLAKMYTLMHDGMLVDAHSSQEMLDFLAGPVNAPPSQREVFIDRASGLDFTVTHTKVGLGPLKTGQDVLSEASILRHASGALFVAAWQNFLAASDGLDPIGHVVRDAIDGFLSP